MWETVGFNRPGFKSVPPAPEKVTATLVGPTTARLACEPTQRTERYRIWKKVVGVDAEFVRVETRHAADVLMEDLPANARIELAMSAANRGGESAKSESVTLVTG